MKILFFTKSADLYFNNENESPFHIFMKPYYLPFLRAGYRG